MDGKGGLFGNVDLQSCHAAHLKTHANAHAERWVRSIKEECLSKLILFGETSLRRVVSEYLEHYHQERNHQGKGNLLLFPVSTPHHAGSARRDPLSGAARRLTQVLQPDRMSILAKRLQSAPGVR